ncbi:MAG: hypothetical protein COB66_06465 [Coxiella sp. (in: Bacteria)]|nr:MAG: hypothetical protein COB66_06465 [Coxiella sp. (in: g-proteobacteria)]
MEAHFAFSLMEPLVNRMKCEGLWDSLDPLEYKRLMESPPCWEITFKPDRTDKRKQTSLPTIVYLFTALLIGVVALLYATASTDDQEKLSLRL